MCDVETPGEQTHERVSLRRCRSRRFEVPDQRNANGADVEALSVRARPRSGRSPRRALHRRCRTGRRESCSRCRSSRSRPRGRARCRERSPPTARGCNRWCRRCDARSRAGGARRSPDERGRSPHRRARHSASRAPATLQTRSCAPVRRERVTRPRSCATAVRHPVSETPPRRRRRSSRDRRRATRRSGRRRRPHATTSRCLQRLACGTRPSRFRSSGARAC